jgi:hypothetical protein
MLEEPSDFVRSITVAIMRRADTYVEMLHESSLEGKLRLEESRMFDQFEKYAADVLDRYVPKGPRRRDGLVFGDLYSAEAKAPPEDNRRSLISALLAAETEFSGPLRLTQAQNVRLARIFEHLGAGLIVDGLPLHAAFAFDRAADLYLQLKDGRSRDRCLLAHARARNLTRRCGPLKAWEKISSVLCGYGYQPYRLLGWIFLELVVFSVALALISSGDSFVNSTYASLINYVNPLGLADTKGRSQGALVLLALQGYIGDASLTIFFALLVRRWFRV